MKYSRLMTISLDQAIHARLRSAHKSIAIRSTARHAITFSDFIQALLIYFIAEDMARRPISEEIKNDVLKAALDADDKTLRKYGRHQVAYLAIRRDRYKARKRARRK